MAPVASRVASHQPVENRRRILALFCCCVSLFSRGAGLGRLAGRRQDHPLFVSFCREPKRTEHRVDSTFMRREVRPRLRDIAQASSTESRPPLADFPGTENHPRPEQRGQHGRDAQREWKVGSRHVNQLLIIRRHPLCAPLSAPRWPNELAADHPTTWSVGDQ
jgi:hypothetical protein